MTDLFFELIRLSIGTQKELTHTPTQAEWRQLYDMATGQALFGVCFAGVAKLPKEQRPDAALYAQWAGMAVYIQQQNEKLDKRTALVWKRLKEAGLDAAILKGQGIATRYGELASLRQSGDIDVWVLGGYQTVCDYVQHTAPTTDLAYHRFHFDVFRDTEVELHFRPTLMRNLLDDRRLAHWYNAFPATSFQEVEEKGFCVPSDAFNRIFIMTHIYRHFLFEGIGLRQVMDYYFLLLTSTACKDELKTIRSFRLMRFAGALMWVLQSQFGLDRQHFICTPDEREGRFLLQEIMQTGNFGQADTRYLYTRFRKLRRMTRHGLHLLMHYPSEVVWTPIWLVYHRFWRKRKVAEIKRNYQ